MADRKILILMSHTGGGHRACAEALRDTFPPQYEIQIEDLLIDHMPWPVREIPKTYGFVSGKTPRLWKFLWNYTNRPDRIERFLPIHARISRQYVAALLQSSDPSLIISVHPLVQGISFAALDYLGRSTPYYTVVTDPITTHASWFHPRTDFCFVTTNDARKHALSIGLQPDQIGVYGFPIHPKFAEQHESKTKLRGRLGLQPDLPVALVMGGGDGFGRIRQIVYAAADRLSQSGHDAGQIAVICGHNRRLAASLAATQWPVPVVVKGFIDNMVDWMVASDCVITKAGPGTIFEAIAVGLPIILSGYIPGQEEGNVAYVVQNGIGVYEDNEQEIAEVVVQWFKVRRSEIADMTRRMQHLSQPHATTRIVNRIIGTAF